MTESIFNNYSTQNKAISAGWQPDKEVHPDTVKLMNELDIDVSTYSPQLLTEELMELSDEIIAINTQAFEKIPPKYQNKAKNWKLPILSDKPIDEVRKIRDLIKIKVKELILDLEK
tara:strand:+ start:325 stop:672 length:348 start_codon:yes stop_codon:yes gene_type:complete